MRKRSDCIVLKRCSTEQTLNEGKLIMAEAYKEATAEMEKHFQVVAKRIGDNWRWLGRKLEVYNSSIECIDIETKSTEEKAFQVLMRWYRAKGQAVATKEALVRALIDIGEKSIAEVLSPVDFGPAAENGNIEKREERSRNRDGSRNSPVHKSPLHTKNDSSQVLEKVENELDGMVNICLENVMTSPKDCTAMVLNLKFAQRVQALNKILMESTQNKCSHNSDETATDELNETRRLRCQNIEGAMRAIHQSLSNREVENQRKDKSDKTRPVSMILRRVTSVVDVQTRSATFSLGSSPQISSPITTIKYYFLNRDESCPLSPKHDGIKEKTEESDNVLIEESNIPPRCKSYGGCMCFEIERSHSETSSSNRRKEESSDENCNLLTLKDDFSKEETNTDDSKQDTQL